MAKENSLNNLRVEVAYALPERQMVIALTMPPGATVLEAIVGARIQAQFPELDLATAKVGIFGKLSRLDAVLSDGDRVEIYRPLRVDPKERRRQRALTSS